jgi:hypothetical protein
MHRRSYTLRHASIVQECVYVHDRLAAIRQPLLDLHRALLDAERSDMERFQGPLSSAEFLQIATGGIRLGWLQPLSELIVVLDEALEARPEDDPPDPQAIVDRARALVAPPEESTPFGRRYLGMLQREPGVVIAHGALVRALEA